MEPGSLIMERSGHVAFAAWLGLALNNYRLAVQVNALPAYGTQAQICYVKMERNIRFFLGIVGTGWKTTSSSAPRISPSNTLPWDGVPGGTQNVERGGPIGDKGLSIYVILNVKYNIDFNFSQHEFSFVPLTSSLDVQNVNMATFGQSFLFPANGSLNGSRADKFLAQEKLATNFNLPHTDFTARNSKWIYNEMVNNNQSFDCKNYCDISSLPINGSKNLCSCETYTIDGLDPASTVIWSISSTGIASITPNGSSVTLCKIMNGTITLTATITSPTCGNGIITKTIFVGLPYITQNAGSGAYFSYSTDPDLLGSGAIPNQICTGEQISVIVNVERASGVIWSRTWAQPSNTTWSQSGNSLSFYLWGNDQKATYKVKATNICGSVEEFFPFKSIDCTGGPEDPCLQYVVSPNPATNVINVIVPNILPPCGPPILISVQKSMQANQPSISQLKLYNQNMKPVKTQKTSKGSRQSSLNIAGLTPGVYILEITDGKYIEKQKVIIY